MHAGSVAVARLSKCAELLFNVLEAEAVDYQQVEATSKTGSLGKRLIGVAACEWLLALPSLQALNASAVLDARRLLASGDFAGAAAIAVCGPKESERLFVDASKTIAPAVLNVPILTKKATGRSGKSRKRSCFNALSALTALGG